MSAIDLHQQADELEHVRVAHGGFRRCALLSDVDADVRVLTVAISRARLGDREALRYLYIRYADNVYSYVVTIVHDPHEAEDVTQHVFVKLLTIIASYDEARAPFATWIMRVARNAAIDHLRQLRMVPCEEVRRDVEADTVADEERQRSLLLREVLAMLPPDQRQVILLRHLVGLTPGEIADRLGKTESSIHGLHHRGRGALRHVLSELGSAPTTHADAA
jgi:RNA polymerase sigma-70 factor (ECF subfamily)